MNKPFSSKILLCCMFTVIFLMTFLGFDPSQALVIDTRKQEVFHGESQNLENVIVKLIYRGDMADYIGGAKQQAVFLDELEESVYQETIKLVPPELNLKVFKNSDPKKPSTQGFANLNLAIRLEIKNGKELDPPIDHYIATVTPYFKRQEALSKKLDIPSSYNIMIFPKDHSVAVAKFSKIVSSLVEAELKMRVCSDNIKGTSPSICQSKK